jgi:hypothetical protein
MLLGTVGGSCIYLPSEVSERVSTSKLCAPPPLRVVANPLGIATHTLRIPASVDSVEILC